MAWTLFFASFGMDKKFWVGEFGKILQGRSGYAEQILALLWQRKALTLNQWLLSISMYLMGPYNASPLPVYWSEYGKMWYVISKKKVGINYSRQKL